MKNVYLNGNHYEMSFDQILNFTTENNLRVIVNKTNGFSHDWQVVEDASIGNLKDTHIYLTDKPIGRLMGSSSISFS